MRRHGHDRQARGLMLATVLVIVMLLSLLGVSFGFAMRANMASTTATGNELQARLAAESGVQRVVQLMRTERMYVSAWYDNPAVLANALVWRPEMDDVMADAATSEDEAFDSGEDDEQPGVAWRFSIVGGPRIDDAEKVRFGVVPESAKLNINVASEAQLTKLFEVALGDVEVNMAELVDALLDWRDSDSKVRPNGAEADYYRALLPVAYTPKNGPFETVEELLLVKGFTGELLFDEDYNHNGLLDVNEDDGDESFPPDDADGELDRGLLPYLTVWSREMHMTSDGRPRIALATLKNDEVADSLADYLEPDVLEYLRQSADANDVASPVDLFLREDSPLTADDLPIVLDWITTMPVAGALGLINVNVAPAEVLGTIEELVPYLDDILAVRDGLTDEEKRTPAWLHTSAGVPLDVLATIYGARPDYGVTTAVQQFSIESVGHADHVGVVYRMQVVMELVWPSMPQVLYRRDLNDLGMAYRVSEFSQDAFTDFQQ